MRRDTFLKSLAALAANQEASAQFLEAFRGVLKQMGVAEA